MGYEPVRQKVAARAASASSQSLCTLKDDSVGFMTGSSLKGTLTLGAIYRHVDPIA
jgi:hypothetical protein